MFIGIDIGGTFIKSGVVNEAGDCIFQASIPTNASAGKLAVLATIDEVVENILAKFPNSKSVGIGVPGVVRPSDGCVFYPPNLPEWDIVPLKSILSQKFRLPLAVDNDANTAAIAESELGAGKDCRNFLYLTLGTGVGGGIIINNRIYSGERGGAGEIGHIIVNAYEMPTSEQLKQHRTFRAGALEEHIGRTGVIAMAQELARQFPNSSLNSLEEIDVKDIAEAAQNNDSAAIQCLKQTGFLLGIAISTALAVLDMSVVVVGGGISQAPFILKSAEETVKLRAIPTIAQNIQIRKAHFGANVGVIGAAMLGKWNFEIESNKVSY